MKYRLSFHTVFLLNENVRWLEEFIVYYKNLGFQHFYLYDNIGSDGNNGEGTKDKNQYGFPVKTTPTEEDLILLQSILEKYGEYITYIKWQPIKENVIVYGYNESFRHCIEHYGFDNEWIAFFDLDEFIFSEKNINLPDYLDSLDSTISCVKLIQKKFLDRHLTTSEWITQEFNCINDLKITTQWAPKNILRPSDVIAIQDMHNIKVKNKTITPDTSILRFNHYNTNEKQLIWMKGFYNTSVDFKINGTDTGMIRYKDIFTQVKSFNISCKQQ